MPGFSSLKTRRSACSPAAPERSSSPGLRRASRATPNRRLSRWGSSRCAASHRAWPGSSRRRASTSRTSSSTAGSRGVQAIRERASAVRTGCSSPTRSRRTTCTCTASTAAPGPGKSSCGPGSRNSRAVSVMTKKTKKPDSIAARKDDERFNFHLELSSEWYWEQDENCRFTLIKGESFERAGIDPRGLYGTTRWDGGAVPFGDNGSWEAHKAALAARQPFANFVYRRVDSQGDTRYISASGQPVFDAKKRFKGYRGIGKDITASMRAEQLLRLEHVVARSLSEADSASDALKSVIRAISETQSWEVGRYFSWDDKAGLLVFSEFWHVPEASLEIFIEKSRELTYAPGAGLIGKVMESGQPLWVTDLATDPRTKAGIAREAGMHGAFLFPVMSEGKPFGVLVFHSREVREPEDRLLQAVRVIGGQIGQFVQRKRAEERVQYMATHDALTSLPNRVMFSQLLNHEIRAGERYQRSFAVMFIDLDRFKFVNDTLGHEAGDKLLQEVSTRFKDCLRASDVVSRVGGDEFVVLVQEVGDAEAISNIARKILSAAIKPIVVLGQECRVTASIGICMYPKDAQDEQSLLKNADIAMYLAKEQGKNNFQFLS